MSIPYDKVLANGKIVDADIVMKSIDNDDGEYNRNEIYCPCGKVQLSYVKNTNKKNHFRAKRGSVHKDECRHQIFGIDIKENNDFFQERETPENIISELDWMSRKQIDDNLVKKQQNSDSYDTKLNQKTLSNTGLKVKYSHYQRTHLKLNKHFKNDIINRLEETSLSEFITYCYGEVILISKKCKIDAEWHDLYIVRLAKDNSYLFSLLCPQNRNNENYVPKSMRELEKASELISEGKIEKVYFSGLVKFQRNGNYLNAHIYKKDDKFGKKGSIEGLLLKY